MKTTNKRKIPLLIAEIANCHGGSAEYFLCLCKILSRSSIPAVKLQLIAADDFLTPAHSQYKLFRSLEFKDEVYLRCVKTLRSKGKAVIFDVFGERSLKRALKLGADMLKIYASDINNYDFIKKAAKNDKNIFISTGGSELKEIDSAVKLVPVERLCLLTGFQSFPTPIEESNLNKIEVLKQRYGCSVGYMDHSDSGGMFSDILPLLAVAKGAVCVEKHVFLPERKKTYDYQSSVSVERLENILKNLNNTLISMGTGSFKLSDNELKYLRSKRKVAVAAGDIELGCFIEDKDIIFACADIKPNSGFVLINEVRKITGKKIKRKLRKYDYFRKEDF